MKCLMCENLSFSHICTQCQRAFLQPSIYKRKLPGNTDVISFYKYNDIKELLHTKHTDLGYYVYTILAKNAFEGFAKAFKYDTTVASIAIDDNIHNAYSHTAILNKHLKSNSIRPLFNKLRAKNQITYSGKTKEFRLLNPRGFSLQAFQENNLILVDDIITSGSTLTQAIQTIKDNEKNVLFCLTLADVSLSN